MNFTQDEIAAVIGTQQLEIIALRREVQRLQKALEEKEKKDGTA